MIVGHPIAALFSEVMGSMMWVGVVLGLLSALLAGAALARGRDAFAPFALWGAALLAAGTGIGIGAALPLAAVGAAGAVALAAGLLLHARAIARAS